MKIYLGADHRGFAKKEKIQKYLEEKDYEVIDLGADSLIPDDDYPDYAFAVAESVAGDSTSRGILLCGSSLGVVIAANKVKGIIASNPDTPEEAKEDRIHHGSNVLALSSDHENIGLMEDILDTWLTTSFEEGGRHERRIEKIKSYEFKIL